MPLTLICFKNFITLQRGFDLPKQKRIYGKYPIVASTSITDYHNEYKVDGECVITGRSGALGEIQYINGKFWPLNTALWVKDFKNNVPKYVYYFLKIIDLKRFNSGAGVPTLNKNDLDTLQIRIYKDKATQSKIAGVLSAYDDLIENNNKRIKILEEMAQKLYKHWLIDFKFPGYENTKFIESELGLIPETWKIVILSSQLAALESGKRPKGGIVNGIIGGIASIGAENINGIGRHNFGGEKFISREFFNDMNKGIVRNRDVAIYKDGAYIGKSSYFRDGFPHAECCVNEHVFLLRTNGIRLTQNTLYLWLQEQSTIQMIRATNANVAQPGINQQSVGGLKLILPDKEITTNFDLLIEPLLAEVINLAKQNNNLQKTRGLLLPRLISGEISVEDLEVRI